MTIHDLKRTLIKLVCHFLCRCLGSRWLHPSTCISNYPSLQPFCGEICEEGIETCARPASLPAGAPGTEHGPKAGRDRRQGRAKRARNRCGSSDTRCGHIVKKGGEAAAAAISALNKGRPRAAQSRERWRKTDTKAVVARTATSLKKRAKKDDD